MKLPNEERYRSVAPNTPPLLIVESDQNYQAPKHNATLLMPRPSRYTATGSVATHSIHSFHPPYTVPSLDLSSNSPLTQPSTGDHRRVVVLHSPSDPTVETSVPLQRRTLAQSSRKPFSARRRVVQPVIDLPTITSQFPFDVDYGNEMPSTNAKTTGTLHGIYSNSAKNYKPKFENQEEINGSFAGEVELTIFAHSPVTLLDHSSIDEQQKNHTQVPTFQIETLLVAGHKEKSFHAPMDIDQSSFFHFNETAAGDKFIRGPPNVVTNDVLSQYPWPTELAVTRSTSRVDGTFVTTAAEVYTSVPDVPSRIDSDDEVNSRNFQAFHVHNNSFESGTLPIIDLTSSLVPSSFLRENPISSSATTEQYYHNQTYFSSIPSDMANDVLQGTVSSDMLLSVSSGSKVTSDIDLRHITDTVTSDLRNHSLAVQNKKNSSSWLSNVSNSNSNRQIFKTSTTQPIGSAVSFIPHDITIAIKTEHYPVTEESYKTNVFMNRLEVTTSRINYVFPPSPIESSVTDPIDSTVTDPIKSSVTRPIDGDVTDPVDSTVTDPLENLVTDPIDSNVTDSIDSIVIDQIESSVTDPIDSTLTDQIESSVTDPIDSNEIDPIDGTLTAPLGSLVTDPIDSNVTDPIYSTVIDQIEISVTDPIDSSLTDQIESSVSDPIDSNETDPIDSSVTDPIESLVTDPITSNKTNHVDSTGTDLIKFSITDPIDSPVTEQSSSQVTDLIINPATDLIIIPITDQIVIPSDTILPNIVGGSRMSVNQTIIGSQAHVTFHQNTEEDLITQQEYKWDPSEASSEPQNHIENTSPFLSLSTQRPVISSTTFQEPAGETSLNTSSISSGDVENLSGLEFKGGAKTTLTGSVAVSPGHVEQNHTIPFHFSTPEPGILINITDFDENYTFPSSTSQDLSQFVSFENSSNMSSSHYNHLNNLDNVDLLHSSNEVLGGHGNSSLATGNAAQSWGAGAIILIICSSLLLVLLLVLSIFFIYRRNSVSRKVYVTPSKRISMSRMNDFDKGRSFIPFELAVSNEVNHVMEFMGAGKSYITKPMPPAILPHEMQRQASRVTTPQALHAYGNCYAYDGPQQDSSSNVGQQRHSNHYSSLQSAESKHKQHDDDDDEASRRGSRKKTPSPSSLSSCCDGRPSPYASPHLVLPTPPYSRKGSVTTTLSSNHGGSSCNLDGASDDHELQGSGCSASSTNQLHVQVEVHVDSDSSNGGSGLAVGGVEVVGSGLLPLETVVVDRVDGGYSSQVQRQSTNLQLAGDADTGVNALGRLLTDQGTELSVLKPSKGRSIGHIQFGNISEGRRNHKTAGRINLETCNGSSCSLKTRCLQLKNTGPRSLLVYSSTGEETTLVSPGALLPRVAPPPYTTSDA